MTLITGAALIISIAAVAWNQFFSLEDAPPAKAELGNALDDPGPIAGQATDIHFELPNSRVTLAGANAIGPSSGPGAEQDNDEGYTDTAKIAPNADPITNIDAELGELNLRAEELINARVNLVQDHAQELLDSGQYFPAVRSSSDPPPPRPPRGTPPMASVSKNGRTVRFPISDLAIEFETIREQEAILEDRVKALRLRRAELSSN